MQTDYRRIAPRYDQRRLQFFIPPDDVLQNHVAELKRDALALDVGCGTGNYLKAQVDTGSPYVKWYGLDPSAEMLQVAAGKVPTAELVKAKAEELPFAAGSLDYIYTSFAFHHVDDKEAALDEVARVLREGGIYRMRNLVPELMRDWWIYRFYPQVRDIDASRFWSLDQLFYGFEQRGFEVDLRVETRKYYETYANVLLEAENRDTSQLVLLDDATYATGLEALRRLPQERVLTEFADLDLRATYRSKTL